MVSSLYSSFQTSSLQVIPSSISTFHHSNSKKLQSRIYFSANVNPCFSKLSQQGFQKYCLPLAVSLVLSWSNPAQAGFLSGSTGIESVPGPQLPSIEFLDRFNEENQKKYAADDERIKSSPIMKELLERSKKNKDKNKQEILDKYCIRGAEWGVGDCSTQGMTAEEKDNFIAMLKQKAAAAAATK
ncbi:hypothetical protein BVRB_6g137180 [Beta vulgaris subsp. vulgaris]|uniref:uncharacterized protein LOC104895838 n=1 Tax=Beta vulgaris subsp. vulgaris TaxID=3555 RepID=UPI00053FC5D2|nr:uncharacterized protein LOC104895838 [Beta vulgaris subsp. vulgaris]KMT09012.1 hypothetical protein BVRB_6g137180 [Beta vulgaris subsp. vulgaris]